MYLKRRQAVGPQELFVDIHAAIHIHTLSADFSGSIFQLDFLAIEVSHDLYVANRPDAFQRMSPCVRHGQFTMQFSAPVERNIGVHAAFSTENLREQRSKGRELRIVDCQMRGCFVPIRQMLFMPEFGPETFAQWDLASDADRLFLDFKIESRNACRSAVHLRQEIQVFHGGQGMIPS